MKREILIEVSPQGEISIEAVAFKGADCESATSYLEEALGAVSARKRKPEYHARQQRARQQGVGG